jgi:hypothetical protein
MENTFNLAISKISNSFEKGQMFEADKMKVMITSLEDNSLVVTILDGAIRKQRTRTLVGPGGEKIKQTVVDSTPKLTDKTRRYSKATFAKLIRNKNFAPTRIGRTEKFFDLADLEVNRFMVKQTVSLR